MILEDIFKEQEKFNKHFFNRDKATLKDKEERTKELILYLIAECHELLNCLDYKRHRKLPPIEPNADNMKFEWIDIFKFWLSIGLVWDFTPEDLLKTFTMKSKIVEQRYKQEYKIDWDNTKIVGLDIDGVLANYVAGVIDFARKYYKYPDLGFYPTPKDYNLGELLGMTPPEYIKFKDDFRSRGWKRYLPYYTFAPEMTKLLKDNGYTIVLITSRPESEYKRIYYDTIYWLVSNNILYDAIYFGKEKQEEIVKNFKTKFKFYVEDQVEYAEKIAKLGIKVYLMNQFHNQDYKIKDKNIIRVGKLQEVIEHERIK